MPPMTAHSQTPQLRRLHLSLFEGCDLACRGCLAQPLENRSEGGPNLRADLAMQAVAEARPLGLDSVHLIGSETLLHPELDALLDGLEHEKLSLVIETSGEGVTTDLALRLARIPHCTVAIGLDGALSETHDAIHNQPGAFQTAAEAASLLAGNGVSLHLVYTVLRANAAQLPPFIRLAEGLGAEAVRFGMAIPGPRFTPSGGKIVTAGLSKWQRHLRVEELIALGRRVERQMAPNTRLQLLYDQPPAFRGLHPQSRYEDWARCGALNVLGVLPTGQYTLCGAGQHMPELVLGEIGQDALADVWECHPALRRLREGMPGRLEGVCGHCVMRSSCMGNCVAENYMRTGSFFGPYWFCEAAERAGLFPAGRLEETFF